MLVARELVELAPGLRVSRLAKGHWQLADRHGAPFDRERAIDEMRAFVEAGVTLFDCADHYVGVEPLIGEFRRSHPALARHLRIATKIVPDLETLPGLRRQDVQRIVDHSLVRLGVQRLDLAQFHWWDYAVPRYVEVMQWLAEMQAAGKIAHLGTTNMDTARLAEITAAGVKLATHQLQYSVLDRRPERGLADFCSGHGIQLLCYGVLAGGFLGERWLGAPEPVPPLANRSLVKYRLIIEDFGGWGRLQQMLAVLTDVARRRASTMAAVATRYVLDKPGVAVAIIGARSAERLQALLQGTTQPLAAEDRAAIDALAATAPGPRGDCYALERDPAGPHSAIMWKNQNEHGAPQDTAAYMPPAYRGTAR